MILFETLVEVICFFNISTLVKLTETCRRFINGSNYHPSVQNPHQMRSLRISYNHCGDYYWTFANNTYQLPSTPINNTAPPNFLSGLSQKIYVEITHMSWEYVQVNFEVKILTNVGHFLFTCYRLWVKENTWLTYLYCSPHST